MAERIFVHAHRHEEQKMSNEDCLRRPLDISPQSFVGSPPGGSPSPRNVFDSYGVLASITEEAPVPKVTVEEVPPSSPEHVVAADTSSVQKIAEQEEGPPVSQPFAPLTTAESAPDDRQGAGGSPDAPPDVLAPASGPEGRDEQIEENEPAAVVVATAVEDVKPEERHDVVDGEDDGGPGHAAGGALHLELERANSEQGVGELERAAPELPVDGMRVLRGSKLSLMAGGGAGGFGGGDGVDGNMFPPHWGSSRSCSCTRGTRKVRIRNS